MDITATQLFDAAIADLGAEVHPLHQAMLEECCENALNNEQGVTDLKSLVMAARVAFLTCNTMLKGTIKAALEHGDTVNLNYRGVQVSFDKNSKYLKEV